MPDLRRPKTQLPPQPQYGYVTSAPGSLTDELKVVLPGFSTRHVFEIRRWMPRGEDLPAEGDEVLVVKDDRGEAWVVASWPA
jgi:hypothetical protein